MKRNPVYSRTEPPKWSDYYQTEGAKKWNETYGGVQVLIPLAYAPVVALILLALLSDF